MKTKEKRKSLNKYNALVTFSLYAKDKTEAENMIFVFSGMAGMSKVEVEKLRSA